MAKKFKLNPNANLPPLIVLGSFLTEKKREFVSQKLFDFGLVRKEYFDRKLGHKKKDFKFKKFLGKRYRYIPAPMTDSEVDQLFVLIQTLLTMTPKANQEHPNLSQFAQSKNQQQKSPVLPPTFLGITLWIFALVGLGAGGYAAFLVYTNAGTLALELAAVIGATSLFFFLVLLVLAQILKFLRALR